MPFVELNTLTGKEVVPGYFGRAIHTGSLTLMYWTVEAGASIPMHQHPHEQIAHVLTGRFELTVDSEKRELVPGLVAVIPPNVPHGGKALTACELLDVFQPEREDYRFS